MASHRNRDVEQSEVSGEENLEVPTTNQSYSEERPRKSWQLFTSHGLVLISILNHPGRTVREIGLELNLTDRAVALAIADLVVSGYLMKEKVGRRTFYKVNEDHPLKYPVSPYGQSEPPALTVRSLRAENLATHFTHLSQQSSPDKAEQDRQ